LTDGQRVRTLDIATYEEERPREVATMGKRMNDATEAMLSIGALSKATGVPVETLRTWEIRYGFPLPQRKPSGHRLYPASSVVRLRRIAAALAQGHRAGQVVPASDAALRALLAVTSVPSSSFVALPDAGLDIPALLELVASYDADRLTHVLMADWGRMGLVEFLDARLGPLIRAVGDAWERGELEVNHEHFLAERVGDVLRTLRLPLEERARGPLVILATLPGEEHVLGLQMAALAIAQAGCRILFLGSQVPIEELKTVPRSAAARALALSVSSANRGSRTAGKIRQVRRALPKRILMLVGGAGAPPPTPGIEVASSFREADSWTQRLASAD
jgi:methanogenic corrinoid protein MtbC1